MAWWRTCKVRKKKKKKKKDLEVICYLIFTFRILYLPKCWQKSFQAGVSAKQKVIINH